MVEWNRVRLDDLARVITGTTPPGVRNDNWGGSVPFLTPSDMTGIDYAIATDRTISDAAAERVQSRIIKEPAVSVVCIGATIGKVALVQEPTLTNQQINTLIPRDGRSDARFLFYRMQMEVDRLRAIASGSATPIINKGAFSQFQIDVPNVAEQRRIAAVLGAFDDLIETSQRLVESLEQQARHAAAQASTVVALSSFAVAAATRQVKPEGLVDHYSLPAFDSGALPEHVDGSLIQSNKLEILQPSVLVSRLNPKWERCWLVFPGAAAVASTEFVSLLGHEAEVEEVWAVTSAPVYWEQMREHATGTTGSHQRVNKATLLNLLVPDVRTLSARARAGIVVAVRAASELRDEIQDLIRTRDELLPLLMSGRVRVEDVEGVVSCRS